MADGDDTIHVRAKTDVGRHRGHNEDRVKVREDLRLYLLADGAGGHRAGEVAAALALESVANYFSATRPDDADEPGEHDEDAVDQFGLPKAARRLASGVHKANADVFEISSQRARYKGMGTTIVALHISADHRHVHVAHVGDSRCYRMRDGYLDQLTDDHSLLNDVLEERPDLADDTLAKLPKNVVTRALGTEARVRVAVRSFAAAPGDRYLLCSDGLSGPLGNRRIAELLNAEASVPDTVDQLIHEANEAGGPDNIGVLIVQVGERRAAPGKHASAPPGRPDAAARDASHPEILVLGIEEERVTGRRSLHSVPDTGQPSDELSELLGELVGPLVRKG